MMGILHYEFVRNAVIASILVGIACGIVGSLVVVKRIVFISGGISHAAFGGIGIGLFLGFNPVIAAIPFSILSALLIGALKRARVSEDTSIGILWAVGMAIGIIFASLTPGYATDLISYLFGNILMVSEQDIIMMIALDSLIILLIILFYREFLAVCFDEEFAATLGIPVDLFYSMLLCGVALSVVVLVKVVGIILVIALLTIPAAIAKQFTDDLKNMIIASTFVCIALTIAGLYLSFVLNLPSGATIVLFSALSFGVSAAMKHALASASLAPFLLLRKS